MRSAGRHIAVAFLFMLMLLSVKPTAASAAFVQTAEGTKYISETGAFAAGLQEIEGKVYLFSDTGVMLTGVQRIGVQLYFFDLVTGARRYGWIRAGGERYYADKKTGVLYANRKKGKHVFGPDGTMMTKAKLRATLTGWYTSKKKTYYYNELHQKVTGLLTIGARTYYFNPSGVLQKKKVVNVGGVRYYIGPKGYALTSRFIKVGKRKYYAGPDGVLAVGITRVGGNLYFFKPNGRMVSKTMFNYNGARYYAKKSGKLAAGGWFRYKKKYYWADEDGKIAVNRFIGTDYYVGADGVRVKSKRPASGVVSKDGKVFLFGQDGTQLVNQWVNTTDGKRYYAGADGSAVKGLQIIGGYKYYFNDDCVLQTDAVIFANGFCYYTDPTDAHIVSESAVNGNAVVTFAKEFVGNPYVYGGTSLTNGADCSGFTQSVMLHFGIRIMRVADDQMDGASDYYANLGYARGIKVSDDNLQPGDLVFYGSGSYASHVAIYMGNSQVVHAANSRVGIIISSIDYVSGRLHNMNRRYWAG